MAKTRVNKRAAKDKEKKIKKDGNGIEHSPGEWIQLRDPVTGNAFYHHPIDGVSSWALPVRSATAREQRCYEVVESLTRAVAPVPCPTTTPPDLRSAPPTPKVVVTPAPPEWHP